jgi:hypothetical protein
MVKTVKTLRQPINEMSEWDAQVCARLSELWNYAHSPDAEFLDYDEVMAEMQQVIDRARTKEQARQASARPLGYATI